MVRLQSLLTSSVLLLTSACGDTTSPKTANQRAQDGVVLDNKSNYANSNASGTTVTPETTPPPATTPPATKPADPVPSVSLKANNSATAINVTRGANVTLEWSSQNVDSCQLAPLGAVAVSGSRTIANIQASTTYVLTCVAKTRSVDASVSVNVNIPAALTANISAAATTVDYDTTAQISWSSSGASSCSVMPGNKTGTSGNFTTGKLTQGTTYQLLCTNAQGTEIRDSVSIAVRGQTYVAEPTIANITYCNTQKLDLARPKNATGPLPAIVFVHGGGWTDGDKSFFSEEIALAATKGFVAVTINYRLTMPVFPGNVQDVKCAIRWLRANAATYNVDKNRIGIMGASAGGNLAMIAAYSNDAEFKSNPFNAESSRVQAVVNWYGVSDMVEQYNTLPANKKAEIAAAMGGAPSASTQANYDAASPVHYINAGDPPTQSSHGSVDTFVRPAQTTTYLHPKLTSVGIDNSYKLITGYQHGFDGAGLNEARTLLFNFFIDKLQ